MVRFIDEHREEYGVEPICSMLPIAPSTYYSHKAEEADPTLRSSRAQEPNAGTLAKIRAWYARTDAGKFVTS